MSFDPDQCRRPEKVYLTQDCIDALVLVVGRSEERDKFVESAIWKALSPIPGVVDCVNERREALRKFKAAQKDLTGTVGND